MMINADSDFSNEGFCGLYLGRSSSFFMESLAFWMSQSWNASVAHHCGIELQGVASVGWAEDEVMMMILSLPSGND